MISLISDLNMDDEQTTLQIIEWKDTRNSKTIEVVKTFAFKPLQPGELEFWAQSHIPRDFIISSDPKYIIKELFRRF